MKKLMVIIPDRLSALIKKGEITERYYNPGNLFDEVHIIMTNDDVINPNDIQNTAGDAKLFIYNIHTGMNLFIKSLGWRPFLLNPVAKEGIKLAEQINPDLIRCHGNHLNAFIAYKIHEKLKIPYVISFHINPDEDIRGKVNSFKDFLLAYSTLSIEKISVKNAVKLMPVYTPILSYLKRIGAKDKQIKVCYNVLNPSNIIRKMDYKLSNPIKLVSVGRQFKDKDCSKIIKAVSRLENIQYTLYGDGAYHDRLKQLAKDLNIINKKIFFVEALSNDELCKILPSYDVFITHTEYAEISKSVLEAQLSGLPMVLNKRHGAQVKELQGEHVILVNNDEDEYMKILKELISNNDKREQLGINAQKYAWDKWDPKKTELKYVNIYKKVMK